MHVGIQQGRPAKAKHTQVAAIGAIVPAPVSVPDRAQPKLESPPERQMHGQQQPIEAGTLDHLAALDVKAPALAILIGCLAPGALPVLPDPVRAAGPVRDEDPGSIGCPVPAYGERDVAPARRPEHLASDRHCTCRVGPAFSRST